MEIEILQCEKFAKADEMETTIRQNLEALGYGE